MPWAHEDRPTANKVFLSYCHKDCEFVDKLAVDLREAQLPIHYDSWALQPGDSLLEKISTLIDSSFAVVCVLSEDSIHSKWVAEELKIASERNLPIIPVAVDDSFLHAEHLRPFLDARLVAKANGNYLRAVRQILERVGPRHFHYDQQPALDFSSQGALAAAIDANALQDIKALLEAKPDQLLKLFKAWSVREYLPLSGGRLRADGLVISGQSGMYDCVFVHLCETSKQNWTLFDQAVQAARSFKPDADIDEAAKRLVALRLVNSYGAHQIVQWRERPLFYSHLVIHGRRPEYVKDDNILRRDLRQLAIDVASYDRLLDQYVPDDLD